MNTWLPIGITIGLLLGEFVVPPLRNAVNKWLHKKLGDPADFKKRQG